MNYIIDTQWLRLSFGQDYSIQSNRGKILFFKIIASTFCLFVEKLRYQVYFIN